MANASSAHACTSKPQAKPLPHIAMTAPGSRILAPLANATDIAAPLSNSLMMIADDASAILSRHQDTSERFCFPGRLGRWGGLERRRDHLGKMWDRSITMVSDDFGQLVEVSQ